MPCSPPVQPKPSGPKSAWGTTPRMIVAKPFESRFALGLEVFGELSFVAVARSRLLLPGADMPAAPGSWLPDQMRSGYGMMKLSRLGIFTAASVLLFTASIFNGVTIKNGTPPCGIQTHLVMILILMRFMLMFSFIIAVHQDLMLLNSFLTQHITLNIITR